MGIATLIAAGRLDDRLIDRALGSACASSIPKAAFLRWIDEGDAADLRFAGDAQERAGRSMGSKASTLSSSRTNRAGSGCSSPTWIRPSSDRNASTSSPTIAGLKDKVARITERAMQGELDFPGALRERVRLLAGLDERALEPLPRRARRDHRRGGDPRPDDARGRRELPARLRRLSLLRRADRERRRVRSRQGQPPGLRRRQAYRAKSAIRSSMRWPSAKR